LEFDWELLVLWNGYLDLREKTVTQGHTKLHNEEFHNLYSSQYIDVNKSQGISVGHAARMNEINT
jgi:hypothetical protein